MADLVCPEPPTALDNVFGVVLWAAVAAVVVASICVVWRKRGVLRWIGSLPLAGLSALVVYAWLHPNELAPTCARETDIVGLWSGVGASVELRSGGVFEVPGEVRRGAWRLRPDVDTVAVVLDPPVTWAARLHVYRRGSTLRLQPYIDDSVAPDREWGEGLRKTELQQ